MAWTPERHSRIEFVVESCSRLAGETKVLEARGGSVSIADVSDALEEIDRLESALDHTTRRLRNKIRVYRGGKSHSASEAHVGESVVRDFLEILGEEFDQ